MSGYACKECGAPAFTDGDVISRTCEHGGTIIASMEAVAYGEGHVDNQPSRLAQIVDAIIRLVKPA